MSSEIRGGRLTALSLLVLAMCACAPRQNHYVIASTSTIIGVEVGGSAAATPQAKLGYNRSELALVPTNRSLCQSPGAADCESVGDGAADSTDVLMELRYSGIFDTGASSGIYQRLAVGANAVRGSGAAVMFTKDADGNTDPAVAAAVSLSAESLEQALEKEKAAREVIAKGLEAASGRIDTARIQSFAEQCMKLNKTESKQLASRFGGGSSEAFENWLRDNYTLRAERWRQTCKL